MWSGGTVPSSDTERAVSIQISIGDGLDPSAAGDISAIAKGTSLAFSNDSQLFDYDYGTTDGLALFEGDGIPTAVSANIVCPPLTQADSPSVGVWSAALSTSTGSMSGWTVRLDFNSAHTSMLRIHTGGNVTRATVAYSLNGSTVRSVSLSATGDYLEDGTETTYDNISITPTMLSAPYVHARIGEIEFGAAVTFSSSMIGERVGLVRETDPLRMSAPIDQLEFSLVNVDGQFDSDNPDTLISLMEKWTPVTLAIRTESASGTQTVPMGRYYITSRNGTDTDMNITAQDGRAFLQAVTRPVSLSTTVSVGDAIGALLEGLGVPYTVEASAAAIFPTADATMDGDLDLLTQCLYIRQVYGVDIVPDRDGTLHIRAEPSVAETADALTASTLTSFPTPDSIAAYNGVAVSYGNEGAEATVDLRTSSTEARNFLAVSNPLVTTAETAQEVADTIASKVYVQAYRCEALGEAAYDPGDTLSVDGRWTQASPETYRILSIDLDYDGGFQMTVRAVKA